jgi:hypothetical protein
MKQSTLHTLITAKKILDEASPLVFSGNTHSCSAGLILLQDAIELVVLALLGERSVDETKSLEKKSFDELIGELKATGTPVPKSGTLKALNKQRVITKHYGQLAQPDTVTNYHEAAMLMIDKAVKNVTGKALDEIMLTELLPDCEAKELLGLAVIKKDEGNYLDCLIEIRKAFYVEYEREYDIHRWKDYKSGEDSGLLGFFGRGGMKAPYYTRNKEWIDQNVKTPNDYIQIDHEKIRGDALEWGVSTSLVDNLRRLTPQVFRESKDTPWKVKFDRNFPPNEANLQNCNYCLDVAISILIKKKEHESIRRWPKREHFEDPPPIYVGHPLYKLARTDSEIVHVVQEGFEYTMDKYVSGFSGEEEFIYVRANRPADEEREYGYDFVSGYILSAEEKG